MRRSAGPAFFHHEHLLEYSLLAYPAGDVAGKLAAETEFFSRAYDQPATSASPHIIIVHFMAKEPMEETLVRWIHNICHLQPAFSVTLNNFSGFPPHTIYLRIQDPEPFTMLKNQFRMIDSFVQASNCPPIHMPASPHVVLAKRLPEVIYHKAIIDYAHRSFHESFLVDTFVLVKREWESEAYQTVTTFRLAAEPVC